MTCSQGYKKNYKLTTTQQTFFIRSSISILINSQDRNRSWHTNSKKENEMLGSVLAMALTPGTFKYCTLLILAKCPGVHETEKHRRVSKRKCCVRRRRVESAREFITRFFSTEFYSIRQWCNNLDTKFRFLSLRGGEFSTPITKYRKRLNSERESSSTAANGIWLSPRARQGLLGSCFLTVSCTLQSARHTRGT